MLGKVHWRSGLTPRAQTERSALFELGFHWNPRHQVWQHPCGVLRPGAPAGPLPRYIPAQQESQSASSLAGFLIARVQFGTRAILFLIEWRWRLIIPGLSLSRHILSSPFAAIALAHVRGKDDSPNGKRGSSGFWLIQKRPVVGRQLSPRMPWDFIAHGINRCSTGCSDRTH